MLENKAYLSKSELLFSPGGTTGRKEEENGVKRIQKVVVGHDFTIFYLHEIIRQTCGWELCVSVWIICM